MDSSARWNKDKNIYNTNITSSIIFIQVTEPWETKYLLCQK
jgi:hypothetical protein